MRMDLRTVPMNGDHAQKILDWCFDGIYSFYSMRNWAEEEWDVTDPDNWRSIYAVLDGDELVGEFSFTSTERGLEIGLTMRPDLTGKGNGAAFMQASLDLARSKYDHEVFIIRVWELNRRALHTYQKAGFSIIGREKVMLNDMPFNFLTLTRHR
ncbi:MAG: GNAT family N-acetyltransferase [Methanomassiliicoccales archaeon]|nr:GNAT family N-acetyltransferase [Methanomassiliicoccales archaeon]